MSLLGLGLVLPETHYFFLWVLHFLKPCSPNDPTQPTFLDFLGGFDWVFRVDPTHVHFPVKLNSEQKITK